ncbi:MAG: glycosyltransferase family 39 protein [Erysipelotrichaceae bacterium]|nr:glycosyltransferase family 39 protein [Erysipelotrichaceae bacterium]
MKSNNFYKWFNKVLSVFISIFLMLALISAVYVSCYLLKDNIKYFVFAILAVSLIVILALFRKRIYKFVNKTFSKIKELDKKKMLMIIIITAIVLKIIYSIFLYFDPTLTKDVTSNYMVLVDKFVNEGQLSNTIGTQLYTFVIHLSLIKFLHIPMHIGLFVIILVTIIINFITFEKVIGKEKSFLASMLYTLMPSTILLSFCPVNEIFVMFYISLILYLLEKIIRSNNKTESIISSLLLGICIFIVNKLSYIGLVLLFIIGFIILFTKAEKTKRFYITGALIISVVLSNLTTYSLTYEWRNKENLYFTLLHGSNVESGGRFVEDYAFDIVDNYLQVNNLEDTHDNQEEALNKALISNYSKLVSNPTSIIELLTNKFYILFSGSHYAVEMLNNTKTISSILFYTLLGINEVMYIIALLIGLITFTRAHDHVTVSVLELIILMMSIVLLVCEAMNRYSLFLIPYVMFICIARFNRAKL